MLITGVGATTADLVLLKCDSDTSVWQSTETKKLSLPSGVVVTSFSYKISERDAYAILGSRTSTLAVYRVSPDVFHDPVSPFSVHVLVHDGEAITAQHFMIEDDSPELKGWLFSTGRNDTFVVQRVALSDGHLTLNVVHQLSLPFGPNIEGLGLSPLGNLQVWGFKSKHFIVYDVSAQREIMTVECGGAHRNWAYQSSETGGTFIWTKASKLYRCIQCALPYKLINPGGHGREIKSVAVCPSLEGPQIIATGAEDTDIKLFKLEDGTLKCLQTLRKHNTGIQHLAWSASGRYLFSSGGFEEFFVWKIDSGIPSIDVGVLCHSVHPRSGASDLRIMGFDVREEAECLNLESFARFTIVMAYSDSTVKLWRYLDKVWDQIATADYLTACLTGAFHSDMGDLSYLTTATDGHIVSWRNDAQEARLSWQERHKVHQSAIHVTATCRLNDKSLLVVTGGDDNAIGLTRLYPRLQAATKTLLIPRAHAAAVTGLTLFPMDESTHWLASAGVDQRVKLWHVDVDTKRPGIEGVCVRRLENVFTTVADVSSLEICKLEDGATGVLVCGVGMDTCRLPSMRANIQQTTIIPD